MESGAAIVLGSEFAQGREEISLMPHRGRLAISTLEIANALPGVRWGVTRDETKRAVLQPLTAQILKLLEQATLA